MQKRSLFFSLLLHAVITGAAFLSSPFTSQKPFEFDQVVKVSLTAFPTPSTPLVTGEPAGPAPQPQEKPAEPAVPVEQPKPKPDQPAEKKEVPKKKKPAEKPKKESRTDSKNKTGEVSETTAKAVDSSASPAAVGEGSPFAGATVDNAAFDYPWWFTQAFTKIASNFRNPVSTDIELSCLISFHVLPSGRIIDKKLVASSGIPRFDDACLAAVEQSSPFPPLPTEFGGEVIGITIPFRNN